MATTEQMPFEARIPESIEGPGCDHATGPRLWRKGKKAARRGAPLAGG